MNKDMQKELVVYFDLDGTVARWRSVPQWVTKLPLYFLLLRREDKLVLLFRRMKRLGYDVRVLSKSYNWRSSLEKYLWAKLSGLNGPIVLVPYGESKLRYIEKDKKTVLIDDYSRNLHEFVSAGKGMAGVKFMNDVNGHFGTWKGRKISKDLSISKMKNIILSAAEDAA